MSARLQIIPSEFWELRLGDRAIGTFSLDDLLDLQEQINDIAGTPRLVQITSAVASEFGIQARLLIRQWGANNQICFPRNVAMVLAREAGEPIQAIRRFFQLKSKSTIWHAVNTVADRCETERPTRDRVNLLRAKLRIDPRARRKTGPQP
jgi:chromosomal replication initiation ATPase DnaA